MSEHGGCHDLFSQAPAAVIWLRGPSHVVEFANERSICLLGNRDPVGKPLRDAVPELDGQPFLGLLDSVYATGEPFGARAMPAMLDGQRRGVPERCFFNFSFQPTRNARGKVDGILIQAVEITEQVTGRQRVEQLAEHLRLARDQATHLLRLTAALSSTRTLSQVVDLTLSESLPALSAAAGSISLLDAQGTHLELVGQLGYPTALAEAWRQLPADAPHPFADAMRTRELVVLPAGAAAPGLASAVWVVAPLVVDDQAIGALALHFAETSDLGDDEHRFLLTLANQCAQALERARLSALEHRLRTQADEAVRTKDEFLRTISHELRTPVGIMNVWAEVLREATDPATRTRALEVINDALRAQSRMIDELVDAARLSAGRVKLSLAPTELEPILEAALATVRPQAHAKPVAVTSPQLGRNTIVMGDPDRLQQLFGNLLSNAVKFTPPGGEVEVSVRLDDSDGYVEVSITDTGEGIGPELLPHLFEAFRQGDGGSARSQEGLGLGLAVVAELARLHHGSVTARSEGLDRGATFVVRLPVLSAEASDGRERPLAGLELLIVDDRAEERDGLALLLGRAGAGVTVAGSTAEALVQLDRCAPDLLLSDLAMPEQDGFDLIRTIRARGDSKRTLPAVAFSAHATPEDRDRALTAGFDFHLAKSASIRELVRELSRLARPR